jgi:hypothetical protein
MDYVKGISFQSAREIEAEVEMKRRRKEREVFLQEAQAKALEEKKASEQQKLKRNLTDEVSIMELRLYNYLMCLGYLDCSNS